MPQTKQQLLDEAKNLGLKVEPATKMADLRTMIKEATDKKPAVDKTPEDSEAKAEIAKAGKRSAKAVKEAEEESAKKAKVDEPKPKSKLNQKPTRTKLERRAKGYRKAAEKLDASKVYSLEEAIELAKTTSPTKFDSSVELHVNLSVDPRQADQNIRDNIVLPSGSGKTLKIAALTDEPKVAQEAGADIAGGDDLIVQIDKGQINFDILIATPNYMPKLGKYAKVLGPKGLMPNPKSGTVTTDIKKAVTEAKGGRVEYRVDPTGIVHLGVGKVSFSQKQLSDNLTAVITSIKANKPSSVKGTYLRSAYLTTTMGPSISLDPATFI